MIKLVIWDLDGTILDSSPGVFESFRHTLATLGLGEITDEKLKPFMGPPLEYTFGTLLGHSPEMVSKCLETYREYYLHMGGALNANVYPGVLETLSKSQAAGITNSLATSKAERGAKLTGEHFGFIQYFDVLGTASNDSSRLSKTAVLKYAFEELQKIGADLSRVILIGDRIHDIEGGRP